MRIEDQLVQGLQSPRPFEDLLRVIDGLKADEIPQAEVYAACEVLLARARETMGPGEVEAVLNVMDVVCGWCLPDQKIFDGELPRAHRDPEPGESV